jgi:hypothetical protein
MEKSKDGLEAYIGICLLAVTLYTGIIMLYQLAIYFLIARVAKQLTVLKTSPYIDAIAVQASVIASIVIYLIQMYVIERNLYTSNFFELVANLFTIVGLIWLIKKPSLHPIIMLTVFQLALIVITLTEMLNMDIGSLFHKAFANSILWRSIGLLLMWMVYPAGVKQEDSNSSLKGVD